MLSAKRDASHGINLALIDDFDGLGDFHASLPTIARLMLLPFPCLFIPRRPYNAIRIITASGALALDEGLHWSRMSSPLAIISEKLVFAVESLTLFDGVKLLASISLFLGTAMRELQRT